VGKKEICISGNEIGVSGREIHIPSADLCISVREIHTSLPETPISFFPLHKWMREIGALKSRFAKSPRLSTSVRAPV